MDYSKKDLEQERWQTITSFPKYEISTLGRVRSYHRCSKGRLVSINYATDYPTFNFFHEGRGSQKYIHILVAATFLGPRPEGLLVCHKDGDKTNHRLDNLYYGTYLDNVEDARRHGTFCCGTKVPQAKLNDDKVRLLRKLFKEGTSIHELCEMFGMTNTSLYDAIAGRTWKHVD